MVNASNDSELNSENSKKTAKKPVEIKTLGDVSHSDVSRKTTETKDSPAQPTAQPKITQQVNPSNKPKRKFDFKTIFGVVVLALLIVGAGAGFYLTQYTQQDIRQQAYDDLPGTCTPDYGCEYSCSSSHPENVQINCNLANQDCGTTRQTDICRGKQTGGNCQLCTKPGGGYACPGDPLDNQNCDYSCACPTANQSTCYESGIGHSSGKETPGYDCKNIQKDVIYQGSHVWNCTSEDGRNWEECNPPQEEDVACLNLTGTIKAGSVENLTDPLNFTITYDGDNVSRVELVAHGNFTPPSMGSNWAVMSRTDSPPASGTYSGTTSYQAMVDELVATGHDRDRLLNEGIVFYANVFGPKGFCTGGGVWSGTGEPCTPNPSCNGTISLTPDEPVSKTFNISTEFICPDGSTPSGVERRLAWRLWPPTGTVWNYNPKLDFGGVTTNISQTITIDDINAVDLQSIYVALVDGSLFHTWWDDGDDDLEPYQPIQDPNYPVIEAGDFFSEPMFRIRVADPAVPENITLQFEAPEELCIDAPMCQDVAILDENNNEIIPTASPNPFSVGQVIKFRCAADDPSSPLIERFEFRITEPNGNVVEGSDINPAGKSAVSQNYQITQNGTFSAQCRICETNSDGSCQPYVAIGNR